MAVKPAVPAALLVCGEPFLTDGRWTSFLTKLKTAHPELSVQTFYLGDSEIDAVLAQARSLPFLSSFQIFRLKEAEKLKDLESLERYLEKPFESSVLFFEAMSLAKDSALAKLVAKNGEVHYLEVSKEEGAGATFVRQKLKNSGKVLSHGAQQRLEEIAQASPSFLDGFLEKLVLYAGDHNEISEDMIDAFSEKAEETTDVFQLTNALFAGRSGQALIVLKKLLGEDEKELIPLLGFLHWQLRRMWQAKVLFDDGLSESEVLKRCKVFGKQASFFTRQVRQFRREQLEKAIEGLFQIDWKLKSGRGEGDLGLELWIMEFGRAAVPAGR